MVENTIRNSRQVLQTCLTLGELHDTFSLDELVSLTKDGLLSEWLSAHLLEAQAKRLDGNEVRHLNVDALILLLCEVLSLDVTIFSSYEADMVAIALKRETQRQARERECGTDGRIVINQRELYIALLDENVHKLYLYNDIFSIPLQRPHMTYDGRGNAVINIMANGDEIVDFDGNEIYFYNLTLVFHYLQPNQVKINHSRQNNNRLIFLYADRLTQDNRIDWQEIAALTAGRRPFETEQDFAKRAEKTAGIIVGVAYLEETDYDYWHQAYFLRPIWKVPFIQYVRRYLQCAKLTFNIDTQKAEELFRNERVLLVYADFAADRDEAYISRLYLQPTMEPETIYPLHRLWPCSSWYFTTSSGIAGYGLELIAPYGAEK